MKKLIFLFVICIIFSCNNPDSKSNIIGRWAIPPDNHSVDTIEFMANNKYNWKTTLGSYYKTRLHFHFLDVFYVLGSNTDHGLWKIKKDSLVIYTHHTITGDSTNKVYLDSISYKYIINGNKMILTRKDGFSGEWKKVK
jgi:hypothetical protein